MRVLKPLVLFLVLTTNLVFPAQGWADEADKDEAGKKEPVPFREVELLSGKNGEDEIGVVHKVLQRLKEKGIVDEAGIDEIVTELEHRDKKVNIDTQGDGAKLRIGFDSDFDESMDIGEMLVAILAIVLIFGTPVIIVALVSFNGYRRRKLLHDNVNRLIEQGRDIPPELFDYFEGTSIGKNGLRSSLHRGMMLLAVGLGAFVSLSMLAGVEVGSLGLIPLFMGLAYLITWRLQQSKTSLD